MERLRDFVKIEWRTLWPKQWTWGGLTDSVPAQPVQANPKMDNRNHSSHNCRVNLLSSYVYSSPRLLLMLMLCPSNLISLSWWQMKSGGCWIISGAKDTIPCHLWDIDDLHTQIPNNPCIHWVLQCLAKAEQSLIYPSYQMKMLMLIIQHEKHFNGKTLCGPWVSFNFYQY